jgi:hypothetical protein
VVSFRNRLKPVLQTFRRKLGFSEIDELCNFHTLHRFACGRSFLLGLSRRILTP